MPSINPNNTKSRAMGQQKKAAAIPDARLIQLCADYTVATAELDAIGAKRRDDTAKEPWKEFDKMAKRMSPIMDKIGRTRATTMDGFKAKARLAQLIGSDCLADIILKDIMAFA